MNTDIVLVNIQIDRESQTAIGTTANGNAYHIYRDHLGLWWDSETDQKVYFKKYARISFVRIGL